MLEIYRFRDEIRRSMKAILVAICLMNASVMAVGLSDFIVTDADFPARNQAAEDLGKFLFSDKIMSGNKNISCATCHHAFAATGDGLSLPVGEGGIGLGVTRTVGTGASAIKARVPRQAPVLFNLGAHEFDKMFWDGKVEKDPTKANGFINPAGDVLPPGMEAVLGGPAIFPPTSATEMAGQAGENDVADAPTIRAKWDVYEQRVRAIPEYVELFKKAYPSKIVSAADISIVDIANAIAAFETVAWRCTDTLFDRFVKDPVNTPVSKDVLEGALLFYGDKGKCSTCHSGKFQTDQKFHNIASAQIGPGKGNNSTGYSDGLEDFGRELITKDPNDRFKFKTPSLRQVGLTAPYGHAGAYPTLEDMISHYTNPNAQITETQKANLVMPKRADLDAKDFVVMNDDFRVGEIVSRLDPLMKGISLTKEEVRKIAVFLREGLTDYSCIDLRRDVPVSVPSGLPVYD